MSQNEVYALAGDASMGSEGVVTEMNSDRSLVVSAQCIQRSLAIRIEGYDLGVIWPSLRDLLQTA